MSDDQGLLTCSSSGQFGVRSEYSTITGLTHPLAPAALAFWDARPADGIIIGRDVPSRSIAGLLKSIIVQEPINDRNDLKVRLAGTQIRFRFGCDITGKTMSELFPVDFSTRVRSVLTAIDTNQPQFADCRLITDSAKMLHSELAILPILSSDRVSKWGMTICLFFE